MSIQTINQIIAATLGTLGYALFFNAKKDKFIACTIGGFITWCVYLICIHYNYNMFISNMIASIFTTAYSEIVARKIKTPATVLLLPGIIPLVPGGSLYYSMSYMVRGNINLAWDKGLATLQVALGIAVGIIIVSVIIRHINVLIYTYKNNSK